MAAKEKTRLRIIKTQLAEKFTPFEVLILTAQIAVVAEGCWKLSRPQSLSNLTGRTSQDTTLNWRYFYCYYTR